MHFQITFTAQSKMIIENKAFLSQTQKRKREPDESGSRKQQTTEYIFVRMSNRGDKRLARGDCFVMYKKCLIRLRK